MQREDLTGRKFGILTVREYADNGKWKCECECGNTTLVQSGNLKYGLTKSCGCQRKNIFKDLTGQQFGHLTAIKYITPKGHGKWLCRCICEKEILVNTDNLASGHSRSCGCQKGAMITKSKTRHGKSFSKVHRAWLNMKSRCFNPNNQDFQDYGGRGITVCNRWLESFENFYADMGDPPTANHSIDRKDSNGNYEPGNCHWATSKEQRVNQRRTRIFEYQGESHTLKEWAKLKNMPYSCLQQRVTVLKWPFEKAIETEIK